MLTRTASELGPRARSVERTAARIGWDGVVGDVEVPAALREARRRKLPRAGDQRDEGEAMRRLGRVLLLVGLLSLALAGGRLGGDLDAHGAANPQSNCVGVLTSFFGPQTQVDDAVHTLRAATAGTPFGQLARTLAQTAGSLDQCLALVGQPRTP